MAAYETTPVHVPDHVTVTGLRAAIAVSCSRCRATEWLYHTVVAKDRDAVAKAVQVHHGCVDGAGGRA